MRNVSTVRIAGMKHFAQKIEAQLYRVADVSMVTLGLGQGCPGTWCQLTARTADTCGERRSWLEKDG